MVEEVEREEVLVEEVEEVLVEVLVEEAEEVLVDDVLVEDELVEDVLVATELPLTQLQRLKSCVAVYFWKGDEGLDLVLVLVQIV